MQIWGRRGEQVIFLGRQFSEYLMGEPDEAQYRVTFDGDPVFSGRATSGATTDTFAIPDPGRFEERAASAREITIMVKGPPVTVQAEGLAEGMEAMKRCLAGANSPPVIGPPPIR